MAAIVTGKDAVIKLGCHAAGTPASPSSATLWGMSDFSLSFDRGMIEQDLLGKPGNYKTAGALTVEGSFTQCRFGASGSAPTLRNIVEQTGSFAYLSVSGTTGATNSLTWYFKSCQTTGYDVSIGDGSTITEASIDFTVMNPKDITYTAGLIKG